MGHGEGESDRHGGIHRVAARCQHLQADGGGVAFAGDHHAVARAHGLGRPNASGRHSHGRDEQQNQCAGCAKHNLDSTKRGRRGR